MTQNELLYILTIAEHGNITRAAQELFISQPSLSESLNKVEQEFGKTIFDRTQEGLVPTAFGLRYLDTARKILDRCKRLEADLDEYRQMRRGKLTFGIPMNLGTYLLPKILPAFQELYPDITVQFKENNSSELDKLMLSGKLDFSVMHYETPNEAIHYELLAEDDFYLVMPLALARTYNFPEYRPLSIYDLKALEKEPFLMVANRQKLRQVADSILAQLSIKPNIRYTTKNMETAKRLAAAGMGITFLPHSYLNLFSGVENLACYPLDPALQASWKLVIGYPDSRLLSRCAKEFISFLKQKMQPDEA
ncbi:LysR family transcriptional regulator [Ventrimonas sp. CLA-AP-H27]|uniref:LysR family transcriptional regulator n=1 Tax=Ventrimonas faecis TaxID=3133170 RepID=A0ABV1HQ39_9FIRM